MDLRRAFFQKSLAPLIFRDSDVNLSARDNKGASCSQLASRPEGRLSRKAQVKKHLWQDVLPVAFGIRVRIRANAFRFGHGTSGACCSPFRRWKPTRIRPDVFRFANHICRTLSRDPLGASRPTGAARERLSRILLAKPVTSPAGFFPWE